MLQTGILNAKNGMLNGRIKSLFAFGNINIYAMQCSVIIHIDEDENKNEILDNIYSIQEVVNLK